MLLMSAIVSGLGLGSMYGLMALGFYLTYAVSGTVNFAQGSSMMLGAVLTYTFAQTLGWPLAAALALALALCALYGLVVERLAVRPFASRGSNAWLMSTVALGIVLDNVVMFTFGKEPRSLGHALVDAQERTGMLATVFVDRTRHLASKLRIDHRILLGYTIAHELGHLLMATATHGVSGLMRPSWSHEELQRMRSEDWVLDAADAAAIRDRLVSRRGRPRSAS